MKTATMKRVIKLIFNFGALIYFISLIHVSYAIIVNVANADVLMDVIYYQVEDLGLIAICFIIIATFVNYILERKVENTKRRYEYLWLSLIHLILITLAIAYFSYNFYRDYQLHPEYF